MGLLEIAVSVAAALLVGALTRGAWRTTLLHILSVLAVYWFKPVVPLRSFDFWLPSLTLALVILTWLITSSNGTWRARQNLFALLLIVGVATVVALSRYFLPRPFLTATAPPAFLQYLSLVVILAVLILLLFILITGSMGVKRFGTTALPIPFPDRNGSPLYTCPAPPRGPRLRSPTSARSGCTQSAKRTPLPRGWNM